DDPQGIRAQGERTDLPDALGRAGDHDPVPRRRTPSANSAVSLPRASSPSVAAVMSADPTITPSAYEAISAACSPLRTPSPTPQARPEISRTRAVRVRGASETTSRAPVTPMTAWT